MPKLPTAVDLGARPAPTPSKGVIGYDVGKEFYNVAGGSMAVAMGQTADELNAFYREMDRERLAQEDLDVEDSHTKLKSKAIFLQSDTKEGYLNIHGDAAVSRPLIKEYGERFDAEVKALSDTLKSTEAKQKFARRAAITRLQQDEGILRHVSAEQEDRAKSIVAGAIDVERQRASQNAFDENIIKETIERTTHVIKVEAARINEPADSTTSTLLKAKSALHSSVILARVQARKDESARDYFAKVSAAGELTVEAKKSLSDILKESDSDGDAQRAFDSIIVKYKDYKDRLAAARAMTNPDVRAKTEALVTHQYNIEQAMERDESNDRLQRVVNIIDKPNGKMSDISPDDRAKLTPQERNVLEDRIRRRSEPEPRKTNFKVVTAFLAKDPRVIAKMTEIELMRDYYTQTSEQDYQQHILGRWLSARDALAREAKGDKLGADDITNTISFEEQLLTAMKGAGLVSQDVFSVTKFDEATSKLYVELRTKAASAIEAEEKTKTKRKLFPSERQVHVDRAVLGVARTDAAWKPRGMEKPMLIGSMTAEQRKKGYVPLESIQPGQIDVLMAYARDNNIIAPNMNRDTFMKVKKQKIEKAAFLLLSGAGMKAALEALK